MTADAAPHRREAEPEDRFRGPVKRSMMIAGHATSISLEPIFWEALRSAATIENVPLNALVARIDAERIQIVNPPNLASAIRIWLFARARMTVSDHTIAIDLQ